MIEPVAQKYENKTTHPNHEKGHIMKLTAQNLFSHLQTVDAKSDTGTVRKHATEAVCAYVEKVAALDDASFAGMVKCTNVKAIKRFAIALDFIATGNINSFDKAIAAFVSYIMLADDSVKARTFSDASFTLSGGAKGKDGASFLPNVSGSRLRKIIGAISCDGTRASFISRTVGKQGLLTALGATVKPSYNTFALAEHAQAHPFIVAYAKRLSSIPEGDLVKKLELAELPAID